MKDKIKGIFNDNIISRSVQDDHYASTDGWGTEYDYMPLELEPPRLKIPPEQAKAWQEYRDKKMSKTLECGQCGLQFDRGTIPQCIDCDDPVGNSIAISNTKPWVNQNQNSEKTAKKLEVDFTPINPSHYRQHASGVECIEIAKHFNFCRGNAIKYIWRAGQKNDEIEDLEKAKWFIETEISRLKEEQK